jgi:hypothetical protein
MHPFACSGRPLDPEYCKEARISGKVWNSDSA